MVMDIFTDIDIFADLLEAASRHIAVYILLDEQESSHFVSMLLNCKVNLERIPVSVHFCPLPNLTCRDSLMAANFDKILFLTLCLQTMRVRTVPGITYQSKTGKSFKGQMKDRFLLADCKAVLSGNYR